jgi:hypothetical protein
MEKIQLKSKNQNKIIIIVGAVVLGIAISAGGFFWLIQPAIGNYQSAQIELAGTKEKIKGVEDSITELNELNAGYKDVLKNEQGFVDKLGLMTPEKTNPEDVFPEIENLATKNGLLITSVGVKRNEKATVNSKNINGLGEDIVSLDLIGADYQGIKSFLRVLENDLRLKDIQSLSFSLANYSLHLEFKIYFLNK